MIVKVIPILIIKYSEEEEEEPDTSGFRRGFLAARLRRPSPVRPNRRLPN